MVFILDCCIFARKLKESEGQNCELLTVVAKWEGSLQNNQLRLEEKNRECSLLNRKIEEALTDAQKQVRMDCVKVRVYLKMLKVTNKILL